MKGSRNGLAAIWMAAVMVMTVFTSGTVYAGHVEDMASIQSYSKGAPYEFITGTAAVKQLEDIFTTIDLQDATINDMQREMEAGNLTSEMLTGMYLDRIRAYDKSKDLNSIIWVNDKAMDEARALDKERASGKVRGKLHGIPIVVKDNYCVKGLPVAAGSVALAGLIADRDAPVVKKLRDAGAVIIAKANLSEFAYSAADSHSTMGGDAHNAYDSTRSPAGSSGGTATAVRSNFAAAGLGTDTGGSIRNPSSWGNLFGIRPSKGLTSIDGIIPLLASRDTSGPMAKTAEDLAIVLESMAGSDVNDDYTIEADADRLLGDGYSKGLTGDSLKGKRIAFLKSSFNYYKPDLNKLNKVTEELLGKSDLFTEEDLRGLESFNLVGETDALARAARANLIKGGAEFVDLSGLISDEELFLYRLFNAASSMEYDVNSFLDRYGNGKIKTMKDILETGPDIGYIRNYLNKYDPATMVQVFDRDDYGAFYEKYGDKGYLRPKRWELVLKLRQKLSDIMKDNNADAIMYMYFICPAPAEDDPRYGYNDSEYERAFGPALGLPDMNIPMGFMYPVDGDKSQKLPLGMGLIGPFGGEKALMEIANGYEKAAGETIKKNPSITPALRDERLNSFLDALMEEAGKIDPARYGGSGSSKIRKLNYAYNLALAADYSDPYSVYNAAYELAVAYDKLMEAGKVSDYSIRLSKSSYVYDGKVKKPKVKTVQYKGKTLKASEYTVTYPSGCKNVGTYTVTVKGKGGYTGKGTATFSIKEAANPMKVTARSTSVSYSKLSKSKQTLKVGKLLNISKSKGKLTFSKISGNALIKVNSSSGKVTLTKGMKKGTYKVRIKVTDDGGSNYKSKSKTVKATVKVK